MPATMQPEPSRRSQIMNIKQSWISDQAERPKAIGAPEVVGGETATDTVDSSIHTAMVQALEEKVDEGEHKLAVAVRAEARIAKRLSECQAEFARAVEIIQTLALEKAKLWEQFDLANAKANRKDSKGGGMEVAEGGADPALMDSPVPPGSVSMASSPATPISLGDGAVVAKTEHQEEPYYSTPDNPPHFLCISPAEQVGWPADAVRAVAELQAELQRVKPALERAKEDVVLAEQAVQAKAADCLVLEQRARDTEQMCWDLSNELEAEERKKAAAEDRAQRAEDGMVELRCQLISMEQASRHMGWSSPTRDGAAGPPG